MMNLSQSVKEAATLPAWLKNNPLAIALQRDERAKINKQRAAAKKELDRLEREAAAVLPGMEKEVETAKREYVAAKRAAETIFDRCGELSRKLNATKLSFDRQINEQAAFLRKNYDEEIDEAIMFFRNELARLRLPGTLNISTIKKGLKNPLNFKQEILRSSNAAAVEAAIMYCRKAIDEIEAMKLLPEADLSRIKDLRESLPSSDVFEHDEFYGHAF